ncbi:G5-interacting protein, putative [Leishmania donovani]|uniref:G5-interacting protein, putative n=1 Tax=Leishmania donovani TaxID=5661 RepID=A0A3S7X5G1_LEIDO|nr:G5-interacting protein, putative [Leishmania donovani]
MSNLNPNAPSFPVSNYQPNTTHNKQGYNNGGGPSGGGGGTMQNERYGGGMMYDNSNYHQGGGGGYGPGGGNPGGGYGQGGGYMGNGPQQGYPSGPRMGRNHRQPNMPHSQYQNLNGMVGGSGGGGGGGGMLGNYCGMPAPYQQVGGMDLNGGYDQQPPQQQMPMQPRMHNMPPNAMGMNNSMMGGGGRMPYNSNQRNPMPNMHPNMNPQASMGLGSVSAQPPPTMAPPAPVSRPLSVPPAAVAPSYITKNTPRAVMVVGYKKTGKTSVAQAIAKREGFQYVCLKSPLQQSAAQAAGGEKAEEAEEAEEEDISPLERLAPLRAALEKKSAMKGLVIDDAFSTNKFQAHYVVHYLVKAGLQLDAVVALVPELTSLVERGVSFAKSHAKTMHPEAFEFASSLDPDRVIVMDEDLKLEELAEKAAAEVSVLLKKNDAAIKLEQEYFIPSCPMVTDAELVEQILEAERSAVKRPLPYTFTYSEPNYVLDYVQFVQSAAKLQHYLVTPWIWGDKLSLIGYDTSVYVHLTSYNLLFKLNDVPAAMQELLKKLKSEAEASGAEDPASQVLFCVEASMLDDVIYISDMMIIGKQHGSEMLLHDRVKLLSDSFGKLPSNSSVRLLEHYPVCDIKACLEAYKGVSRGAIFVNPDGIEYGRYDVRNFVYPSETKRTVRLRIWAGSMTDGMWSFDGYVREYEDEVLATSRTTGANNLPVMISDANVDTHMINDGNIVECVMEKTATKGKSRDKNAVLTFCRRCKWEVTPITQFYMWAFADPPQWSTESFLDACSTIASVRPTV